MTGPVAINGVDNGVVDRRSMEPRAPYIALFEGTPQEGGASTPLAAPGSLAAAAIITRTDS